MVHEHAEETGDASCKLCVTKHIGHASVFLQEASAALDEERRRAKIWNALSQLVAAESQLAAWPNEQRELRALRKEVESCGLENRVCGREDISKMAIRIFKDVQKEGEAH